MSCFECKFIVDDMQMDMIANRKKLSDDVRDFACYKIVPTNMTASCIDFLDLYLPTVIQMTIEQVTAEGVCQANKCCPIDSCKAIRCVARLTRPFTADALRHFSRQEIQKELCPTMSVLEKYIASNLAGSVMEKYLEISLTHAFCSSLFSVLQPTCQQIVCSVAPKFVSLTAELSSRNEFSQAVSVGIELLALKILTDVFTDEVLSRNQPHDTAPFLTDNAINNKEF